MRALLTSLALTTAALFTGCASTDDAEMSAVQPGDRVEVEYRDGPAVLALRNASFQAPDEVYSSGDSSHLKVAADEHLDKLIRYFGEQSFFDVATPSAYPRATATLTLKQNGETYVRSRLPLEMSSLEELKEFNNCLTALRAVYDNTPSYHTASNLSSQDLQQQNERIQENAKEALSRHRGGQ